MQFASDPIRKVGEGCVVRFRPNMKSRGGGCGSLQAQYEKGGEGGGSLQAQYEKWGEGCGSLQAQYEKWGDGGVVRFRPNTKSGALLI